MALELDRIRTLAERIAVSHHLEVVDLEFTGGAKFRTLRVFVEKDATERAKLAAIVQAATGVSSTGANLTGSSSESSPHTKPDAHNEASPSDPSDASSEPDPVTALMETLPKGVPVELLSGVTHEDCATFASDFGTVLDIEELIPGATEYTLEVSSPGLERKLFRPADYTRFRGCLLKLQTFKPVNQNRHLQGRLLHFDLATQTLTLDPGAIKQKGKGKKAAPPEPIPIAFSNIEKANLIPEF